MWQEPISTTQPIPPDQDQLQVQPPPGGSAPSAPQPTQVDLTANPKPMPGTFERRRYNPGGHQMPIQAKAKGLTSWLGSGNNPSLTQPSPMRGGSPAQQNPYLKLAGANANRRRLGRGFTTPKRGFQQGLGQAYQNFLGGQAMQTGTQQMKPRGKAFRGDIGRARAMRMQMRNRRAQLLRGRGRGGMQSPGFPQGGTRPLPTQPMPTPEYATQPAPQPTQATISNPQMSSGGQMQMLEPTQFDGFTR